MSGAKLAGSRFAVRFSNTYRRERAFVLHAVRRLGIPASEAEDAVKEVFAILYARPELDVSGAALRGWLRSVTINVCRNYRRTLWRRQLRFLSGPGSVDPDSLSAAVDQEPEQRLFERELGARLLRAVGELTPLKQRVFLLSALEEQTLAQIAQSTCASPNTVASRLRAARRQLARRMRELTTNRA